MERLADTEKTLGFLEGLALQGMLSGGPLVRAPVGQPEGRSPIKSICGKAQGISLKAGSIQLRMVWGPPCFWLRGSWDG